MAIEKFQMHLLDSKAITPTIRHLTFERVDQKPFQFQAGQFVSLHFEEGGKQVKRSYSIASPPEGKSTIDFAISYVKEGLASELFFKGHPELINASGPYGKLVLPPTIAKRYIMVATGTGVTPYRSMLPELMRYIKTNQSEITLLLGVRNPEELLYGEEFITAAQTPGFNFKVAFSRYEPDDAMSFAYKGYVQDYLKDLSLNGADDIVFLCGNPDMIDSALQILETAQFPASQIKREKYVFSGNLAKI